MRLKFQGQIEMSKHSYHAVGHLIDKLGNKLDKIHVCFYAAE